MNFDQLLRYPSVWQSKDHRTGIVISSRIRLARNLDAKPFPGWAEEKIREQIWEDIASTVPSLPSLHKHFLSPLARLTRLNCQLLFERNIISRELAERNLGCGVVVAPEAGISLMVNEEDHLRIQAFSSGLCLTECLARADRVDSEIGEHFSYAFSSKLGYLTACPSNVGTGMRASVMLHIPGLVLMDEIGPTVHALGKLDLAVRGLGGEGSDAIGNLFQVSNQVTLGKSEMEMVESFQRVISELVQHETNARLRLRESREAFLRNHIGRAFGLLSNAWILPSKEALDLLSAIRLGLDMNMIADMNPAVLDELFLFSRPNHLQKKMGRRVKAADRDEFRATMIREKLKGARLT